MAAILPKILFLCTGNSCRSQMAEGWAKALRGEELTAYSAGVEPHGINPIAVKVMSEAGIDISMQSSKHVDDLSNISFDWVITVCDHANETCPLFNGNSKKIHQGFEDPPQLAKDLNSEEEVLQCYRRVRDEIKEFILTLPNNLPLLYKGKGN